MDRAEAIKRLEWLASVGDVIDSFTVGGGADREAFNMAIAALREQEQREQGQNAELIKRLDELAELTPPICDWHKPYEIEIMGKSVTVYCKPFEQFQSLVKQAADALREQEQSKWISVKERLPEKAKELVVVIGPKYRPLVTWYNPIRKAWACGCSDGELTHWMPLPEPPKEGAEG